MTYKECDGCKELIKSKHLKKINKKRLCKKCRVEVRKNHRKETIKISGIKSELNRLKQKISKERGYSRKAYEKKIGHKVREKNYLPKIKGSKFDKLKEKGYCFLTSQERNLLYHSLIKRGLDSNESTERIRELIKSQEELRIKLEKMNKSNQEIKQKQAKLLEELWNY